MRALHPLVFCVLLVACGGRSAPATPRPADQAAASETPPSDTPSASPPPQTPQDEGAKIAIATAPSAPSVGSPPTVKVTETGAAPKKKLRYRFKAGVTEVLEMDMKMSLAMSMGEKTAPKTDLPTIRTTMRIDAKELTPEGDLRCTFNADKVEVLKDVKVDAKTREGLEKELAGLVGMHGKSRISTRGVASESEFQLPPHASQSLNTQMETLRDAIRQLYVPFPEEELGKGATWEVTSRIPINGALVDTKMGYVLTKLEAGGAQADVDISLSAPPNQPMRIGALPAGATATLDSLAGKGSGTVSPSFVRLVGTGSNKVSMESTFAVTIRGQKIEMKMQSDVAVVLRPGRTPLPVAKK